MGNGLLNCFTVKISLLDLGKYPPPGKFFRQNSLFQFITAPLHSCAGVCTCQLLKPVVDETIRPSVLSENLTSGAKTDIVRVETIFTQTFLLFFEFN